MTHDTVFPGDIIPRAEELLSLMFRLVSTVRGGSVNSAEIASQYTTVEEARDAAKRLMHEHQRVVRVMIVEAPASRFVEWMDRS